MRKFPKMIGLMCMVAMLGCLTACDSFSGSQETGGSSDVLETAGSQQVETDKVPDRNMDTKDVTEQVEEQTADTENKTDNKDSRVLVAYFSATGQPKH